MLDFLNEKSAAAAVNRACQTVIADKKNHTRDLGGEASTSQVGDAVCAAIDKG
jgi:isocitrate/isopropylmalate dehydrogenase